MVQENELFLWRHTVWVTCFWGAGRMLLLLCTTLSPALTFSKPWQHFNIKELYLTEKKRVQMNRMLQISLLVFPHECDCHECFWTCFGSVSTYAKYVSVVLKETKTCTGSPTLPSVTPVNRAERSEVKSTFLPTEEGEQVIQSRWSHRLRFRIHCEFDRVRRKRRTLASVSESVICQSCTL